MQIQNCTGYKNHILSLYTCIRALFDAQRFHWRNAGRSPCRKIGDKGDQQQNSWREHERKLQKRLDMIEW